MERCTLWSTLEILRRSLCHITADDVNRVTKGIKSYNSAQGHCFNSVIQGHCFNNEPMALITTCYEAIVVTM
jgi:hypothetical protein